MSGSVLDADMATLGRWLGEGWRWWLGELRGLMPAWLAGRRVGPRGPVAWFVPGQALRVTRGGRSIQPRRGTLVTLMVEPGAVLIRRQEVPALSDADARRLVALQSDRMLPFPPGAALLDIALAPRPADAGRRIAHVAALPVDTATAAIAAAAAAGLRPIALRAASSGGPPAHDFLPAWRAARGEADPARFRRMWWRAAAALFLVNLAVLVGADTLALRNEQRLVDAHGESATMARLARRRVLAEQAARQRLLAARALANPAALLATLTRLLPPGAVVQHLAMADGVVRITGLRHQADVLAALRAGGFGHLRQTGGDPLAATASGQPFDISFDWPSASR